MSHTITLADDDWNDLRTGLLFTVELSINHHRCGDCHRIDPTPTMVLPIDEATVKVAPRAAPTLNKTTTVRTAARKPRDFIAPPGLNWSNVSCIGGRHSISKLAAVNL